MSRAYRKSITLGAAAAFAALSWSATWANDLPFELPALIPNEQMTLYDVPNVPDARGCVKMCVRDDSPCDPPSYKRADNRCSNFN